MGSILGTNRIITKKKLKVDYTATMSTSMIKGMPWPKKGATHYNAQLGLPDKGLAIKGLVVYNVRI